MMPIGSFQKREIIFSFRLKEGNGFEISGHAAQVNISNGAIVYAASASIQIFGLRPNEMNRLSYVAASVSSQNSSVIGISDDWVDIKIKNSFGNTETIFSGQITNGYADYNASPDAVLNLTASNIAGLQLQKIKPLSYKGTVSASQICYDISLRAEFLKFIDHGITGSFNNYYAHGSTIDMLTKVVDAVHGLKRVDTQKAGQILHVWGRAYKNEKEYAVLLNKETGLIGYPSTSAYGVKCKCLFNPAINFWEPIKIESDYLPAQWLQSGNSLQNASGQTIARQINSTQPPWNGTWTPIHISHSISCEIPGGPWLTEFEARRPENMQNVINH